MHQLLANIGLKRAQGSLNLGAAALSNDSFLASFFFDDDDDDSMLSVLGVKP
jgi:hypothetical protein